MNTSQNTKKIRLRSWMALFGLFGFGCVFLIVCAIAFGFILGFCYVSYELFMSADNVLSNFLATGAAIMGLMLVYLIFSFLFYSTKDESNQEILATEQNAPGLLAMTRNLAEKMGVRHPHKIFLSPEVNAAASFNSSFFSMFFPVKKNLHIGLGLINAVTLSELKAIIAHEFGHFSQKSMRVGSYLYQVNRVIKILFFNPEGIDQLLVKYQSGKAVFRIFGFLATAIVITLKQLLLMGSLLAWKPYLALLREMEYHADELGAKYGGSEPLTTGLLRLPLASTSFDETLQFNLELNKKKLRSVNIYPQMTFFMRENALPLKINFQNGLPWILPEDIHRLNCRRVSIDNKWSSHPEQSQRVKRILALNYPAENADNRSAWEIFTHPVPIQEEMTNLAFQAMDFSPNSLTLDPNAYAEEREKFLQAGSLPPVFKGLFDQFTLQMFTEEEMRYADKFDGTYSAIFNEENLEIVEQLSCLSQDIDLLENIRYSELNVREFTFDGKNYKPIAAAEISKYLQKKYEKTTETLTKIHLQVFQFFAQNAEKAGLSQRWKDELKAYKAAFDLVEKDNALLRKIYIATRFFTHGRSVYDFEMGVKKLEPLETQLRRSTQKKLSHPYFREWLPDEYLQILTQFVEESRVYYPGQKLNREAVDFLREILENYPTLFNGHIFAHLKSLLEFQARLLGQNPE